MHGLIWPEFVELGTPKIERQFLASEPMSNFNNKNYISISINIYNEL